MSTDDNTPMKACDYLYAVRAGLNNPSNWSDGTWEVTKTRTKPGRDERGRYVGGTGEKYEVKQRCLMGQLGAVCEGSGTAYMGTTPKVGTPEFNAMRLLALGIDEEADAKYAASVENHRKAGFPDPEQMAAQSYATIIMDYNDRKSKYEVENEEYAKGNSPWWKSKIKNLKKKRHKKILAAVDRAIQICFKEAK